MNILIIEINLNHKRYDVKEETFLSPVLQIKINDIIVSSTVFNNIGELIILRDEISKLIKSLDLE